MAAENLQTFRYAVSASVLRVGRKFDRISVCVARRCDGGGAVFRQSGTQQSGAGNAHCAYTSGAKVPADVYSMHAPEALSSHACRL